MATKTPNKITANTAPQTVLGEQARAALQGAASRRPEWVKDVATLLAQDTSVPLRVLVCGSAEEVQAAGSELFGELSFTSQQADERPIAFIDREAGADVDDLIGAVVYLDQALDLSASQKMSADLRAVLDRCFHDAPVFVIAGESELAASAISAAAA